MFLLKSFVSSLYLIRASSVPSCCSTFETGWSITPWAWDLPSYKPPCGQMIQPRNWGAVSSLRSKHSLMANGARRHGSRYTPLLPLSLSLSLSLSWRSPMPAESFLVVTTVTSALLPAHSTVQGWSLLARIPYALLSTVAGLSWALPTSWQGDWIERWTKIQPGFTNIMTGGVNRQVNKNLRDI